MKLHSKNVKGSKLSKQFGHRQEKLLNVYTLNVK